MNAYALSARYIRSRKLESSLAVLGIALGVATLAGTLSLVSGYERYYDAFSKSPESRQISVLQATRVRVTDGPAVLIGEAEAENVRFSASEVSAALEVCPNVDSFYEVNWRTFVTTAASNVFSGGPGGDGPPMAPPDAGGPGAGGPDGGPGDIPRESGKPTGDTIESPVPEKIHGARVSDGFFAAYGLRAQYGDIFSDSGDNTGVPGAVLGAHLAKTLYAGVTDPARLVGRKLSLSNTTYVIIGVLAEDEWDSSGRNASFNDMAFVPTSVMRAGASGRQTFQEVSYTAKPAGSPARAAIELENYFNSIHGAGSVVAEANLDRFAREVTKRERVIALMAILASAGAITAAINLFNLMTSRVVRRRRPIAIQRALGARSGGVFAQIMIEAAMLGLAGAVGGCALAPAVVSVLGGMLENGASGRSIPVSVSVSALVLTSLGAVAVSLAFAAMPARSGSRVVITDALRSE